jgi:hypothetical protein
MAKNIDYSKIKAMAASILECIGEDEEGEDPSLPKPDVAEDDGGQVSNLNFLDTKESKEDVLGSGKGNDGIEKKKKKDSSIAMMASLLSSKAKKY